MQGLSLRQSCQLATAQSLSMTLSQVQQIALSVSILRRRVSDDGGTNPGNPEELLKKILRMIVEGANQTLRQPLELFFQESTFPKRLLLQRDTLAVATAQKLANFCVDLVFHASTDGGAFIHALEDDGSISLNPPKTTFAKFVDAYKSAETLREKIAEYEGIARKNGATEGMMNELREMRDASQVMEGIRPQIERIILLLQYAFTRQDVEGSLLGNFIRDAVILDRLDLILSENLLKRFVKRCERLGKRVTAVQFEESILNTIGEYTLISMGVISPSIFTRKQGELSESYRHAIKELESIGIPARQLLSHYNLKQSGSLFWYRYHLKNVRSDQVADNKIRRFITETLRKDRQAILSAIGYEEFFPRLKEVSQSKSDTGHEEMIELLSETLANDSFQDAFLVLLRKWYVTFEQFL